MCENIDIICSYDKKLEDFLRDLVNYTVEKNKNEIDIQNLKCVELINSAEFELPIDGRTCEDGTKILLTSRLFEELPEYNIKALKDNEVFITIVNTLFHEMGHVTDWKRYPSIYNCAYHLYENFENGLPSLFWLEYLAEKRSCTRIDYTEYCVSFVRTNWRPIKANSDGDYNSTNFFYLNKHLSYFLARKENCSDSIIYLKQIKDQLLVAYILDLEEELNKLETQLPFDDVERLSNLYQIMNTYYKKFNDKYRTYRNPK